MRNGRMGTIDRFTLYSSNNLNKTKAEYNVIFGHKSAITFATQITKNEKVHNQNDFGELCRALMVFGFEVIKPEALGHAVVTLG